MGDPEKGVLPMIVGGGHRRYGYKWIKSDKGRNIGVELNNDIAHTFEDGKEWTEGDVILYIFNSSVNGISIKEIARTLNDMGVPSPYQAKGIKKKSDWKPMWQPSAIARMLHDKGFAGEAILFKEKVVGTRPGTRKEIRVKTDISEQITIKIPAIVSMELFEKVQEKLSKNKIQAADATETLKIFYYVQD